MCFAHFDKAGSACLLRLFCDEGGATSIEYALVASLVAMTIIGAVILLSNNLQANFYDKVVSGFPP